MKIMTETAEQFIEKKKNADIGNERKFKDIRRSCSHIFQIKAITFMIESNNPEKVFELQRLEFLKTVDNGNKEIARISVPGITYRVGYYIIGKIGRAKGKWWWGQSAPMFIDNDLVLLINKAKKEGTIL